MNPYLELCKPRVVALMLLTAVIGMLLATSHGIPWNALIFGTTGIALCAASAAVINHIIDERVDAVMWRTHNRPLPAGKITSKQASYFAITLGVLGTLCLIVFVNALTAVLTVLTIMGYAGVYTLYLKRATPQNIVIGGAAGAAPPMLGWTAVTGHLDPYALLLMLIIFVWTPPHFWSLAIYREREYAQAKIPMLPVTHGVPFTKKSIVFYTLLLNAVALLPYATGMAGVVYLVGAVVLGAGFMYSAIVLWCSKQPLAAMNTFRYSIYYLMLLFLFLLADHYL